MRRNALLALLLLTALAVNLQASRTLNLSALLVPETSAQAQTFVLSTKEDIRAYVNANDNANVTTTFAAQSMVRNDAVTAARVCRVAGYNRVQSTVCNQANDGRCNFTSCGDNYLHYWNGSSWAQGPACGYTWLSQITCADPINTAGAQCQDGIDNDGDGTIDALVTGVGGGQGSSGNFAVENANPKYEKTWIATITCNNPATGQSQTFGNGNAQQLAQLVAQNIASKNLPYAQPQQALVRSDGGSSWDAPGTLHMPTLNAVCKILGDTSWTYVASTCRDTERSGLYPSGKCNFHSPGDNLMTRFNGTFGVEACRDGIDNDRDGLVDLQDSGCAGATDASEVMHDPGCSAPNDTTENSDAAQCSDGIDNDFDGALDFPADFSCTSPTDTDESFPKAQCQDGVDNDGDGVTDFPLDIGCAGGQDNDEFNVITPQLAAQYTFDDGTARDVSGNANNGSLPLSGVTPINGCMLFGGNPGNYITVNHSPTLSLNSQLTITAWVRETERRNAYIVSKNPSSNANGNYGLAIKSTADGGNANGIQRFAVFNGSSLSYVDSTNAVAVNNWNHIAVTVDTAARQASFYLNGQLTNTAAWNAGLPTNGASVLLGYGEANTAVSQLFKGYMDDVRIYKGILPGAQIAQLAAVQPVCNITPNQCQDGLDNDFDGVADFPADFSCASPTDTDESFPKAQCQDGVDNDGDGKVDFPLDLGCSSQQDNSENTDVSQCADGLDNDNDGAIDTADFSCSGPTDTDETNPKSQCQDGVDNDGDGRTDFPLDLGCTNAQDNSENSDISQCNDGIDNDADGTFDFGFDASCDSPQDNDESNPKNQCQDGVDNDGDGLSDYPNDPGCAHLTDHNEQNSPIVDPVVTCPGGGSPTVASYLLAPRYAVSKLAPLPRGATFDQKSLTVPLHNAVAAYLTSYSIQDPNDPRRVHYTDDQIDLSTSLGSQTVNYSAGSACVAVDNSFPTNITNLFLGAGNPNKNPVTLNALFKDTCDVAIFHTPYYVNVYSCAPIAQCADGLDNDNDGAIDTADFSCSGPTDTDETNPKSQCQDGVDNDGDGKVDFPLDLGCSSQQDNSENTDVSQCADGLDNDNDGAIDTADFSCSGPTDTDETNPKSQCQDGVDNDGDGKVDFPLDLGCASQQDNSENTDVSQCADGLDNDNDGAIDTADFSCSGPTDTDETNPKSQCQDGVDNDGDGLIDFPADLGCSSRQDNDETGGAVIAQCSDGLDNDSDGFTDFPSDFSCSSITDNDETLPKAQCQDNFDNDSDGLVDMLDPGCTSPQDNSENTATSQCQDGIDNDNDGSTDFPADFSCSSPTDNDETLPKSQCSDGTDNDFDGAIDFPADFSCGNKQDNDETVPKSQCQDNFDNDSDGLVDMLDPGCTSPQDNNEGAATTQCQDGIDNDNDGAMDYPADFSCGSPTDNDEANPKARCQDGTDNDGDGLTDFPTDIGCFSRQDNDEYNVFQCLDGIDNDGDGTTDFPSDFSCSSITDNDETLPKTQCQDAVDNDGDGATDFPNDFSCASAQDNDETLPKAQCQDGTDNDGDGLVDFALDPGCVSKQDNSENTATSQCQDGVDNDSDGTVDFPADFSCASAQDNDETLPKAQCQDGIDNDSDGATDFPNDFSCASAQDNDETLPKAQCQDAVDNDGDGLIDFSTDPGCSGRQDDSENTATSQCQDGIDNDSDGTVDFPADFSCASAQDNDETLPKAQCSDGIDNDNDGATDYGSDFSCSGLQDNDEGNPKAQCQDGTDNDADGLTDFPLDPGCSTLQDNEEFVSVSSSSSSSPSSTSSSSSSPSSSSTSSSSSSSSSSTSSSSSVSSSSSISSNTTVDLSIVKTGPTNVTRGGQIAYIVTAINAGPGTATNVVVSDPVPAGLNAANFVAGSSNGCALNAQQTAVLCNNFSLVNGQSRTFAIVYAVPTVQNCTPSTLLNTATVSTSATDLVSSNNTSNTVTTAVDCGTASSSSSSSSSTVSSSSSSISSSSQSSVSSSFGATDLAVTLTGPSSVVRGTNVTYTATVTNVGPNIAQNITVTDPPPGFTFLPGSSSVGCTLNGNTVQCALASLNVGATQTFTIVFATQNSSCNISVANLATVTASNPDPNTTNNQSQSVVTSVTCQGTGNQCQDGVDNDGDGAIDFPADFSCSDAADNDETLPKTQCQDGIDNDGDGQIDFPNDTGCVNRQDNSESGTSTGRCDEDDLDVEITVDDSSAQPGDEVEFEITVINDGNESCEVTLRAELDKDLRFLFASSGGDDERNDLVLWRNLVIDEDDERTVRLEARVDRNADDGDTLEVEASIPGSDDTAEVRVQDGGGTTGGSSSSVPTDARISISKSADRSTAQPGDTVSYTLTLRNTGDRAATNVIVEDQFNAGQLSILDPAGGSVSGNGLRWTFDRIEANTTRTLRYTARISTSMRHGDVVQNNVAVMGGASASDSNLVRIVQQLPQTGITGGSLRGGSDYLSPVSVRAATRSENASAATSIVTVISWLATISTGVGAGALVGKKFLF